MGSQSVGHDWETSLHFKILKDDAVKCGIQYLNKFGRPSSGHRTGKNKFSFQSQWNAFPFQKKGNAKECSNYHIITLISHASKFILKILLARLQQYMNREFQNVQDGFRKGRGTRDKILNIHWIMEKAREFQKKTSASLTMLKPLNVWIMTNCGKFFKRWENQTTFPAS